MFSLLMVVPEALLPGPPGFGVSNYSSGCPFATPKPGGPWYRLVDVATSHEADLTSPCQGSATTGMLRGTGPMGTNPWLNDLETTHAVFFQHQLGVSIGFCIYSDE